MEKKTVARKVTPAVPKFSESLYPNIQNAGHLGKCKYRTAKALGYPIDRVEQAYELLNGKKIDGFYVNDIIDRYGFSDSRAKSRATVSAANGHLANVRPLEIAESKLKTIMGAQNMANGYAKYVKTIGDEIEKERHDIAAMGE